MTFQPLQRLGRRIVICGPSNAGKSTLAIALGNKLGVPHVHLDQLHHLPGSNWVPRPRDDFVALHDEAITHDAWVMDGNYSALFSQRLARATGIILLRSNRFSSLARYFRRTLFERQRAGSLSGGRDSIKWKMIQWILFGAPPRQRAMRETLQTAGLPYVEVRAMGELNRLYSEWKLSRD